MRVCLCACAVGTALSSSMKTSSLAFFLFLSGWVCAAAVKTFQVELFCCSSSLVQVQKSLSIVFIIYHRVPPCFTIKTLPEEDSKSKFKSSQRRGCSTDSRPLKPINHCRKILAVLPLCVSLDGDCGKPQDRDNMDVDRTTQPCPPVTLRGQWLHCAGDQPVANGAR